MLPVSKARTNKFYIYQQCTYIVYLHAWNRINTCENLKVEERRNIHNGGMDHLINNI
jgi:hypothetical protein